MSVMMLDCGGFQAQIASIVELLANSAVVEICKLVEQEREKSQKENHTLRRRLREMEVKMRSYERKMRRRRHSSSRMIHQQQREEEETVNRPTQGMDDDSSET